MNSATVVLLGNNLREITNLDLVLKSYPKELRKILVCPEDLTKEIENLIKNQKIDNAVHFPTQNTTMGALATLGLALDILPDNSPIIIGPVNSYLNCNFQEFNDYMNSRNFDAGIITFTSEDPNYSYVLSHDNVVTQIYEKIRVSNDATAGIFYFQNLDLLTEAMKWTFVNSIMTNNLYYIAPMLNYLITKSKSIGLYKVDSTQYFRL